MAVLLLGSLNMLGSCSRLLGYGVLLWSVQDPDLPSGTVLPVHIKSNIDNVWVVGIPEELHAELDGMDKLELPLWQLEFAGSKKDAEERAAEFAEYAHVYAETIQDGLPIRANPDNSARRVYRLRQGQIIKVLEKAEGNPAMSGDTALPGDWLRVITEDGAEGYCFSYRLRIFEHTGGPLGAPVDIEMAEEDEALDHVLSTTWRPDWYRSMLDERMVDLSRVSREWGFFPAQDTGYVRLSLPGLYEEYQYSSIVRTDDASWRFKGAPLEMKLRSGDVLAVQHQRSDGSQRTYLFTSLGISVQDMIAQETERRDLLYDLIFEEGPVYRSENYGTLAFTSEKGFSWLGYDLIVPALIPADAKGTGSLQMSLFLQSSLQDMYDGAFMLSFDRDTAAVPAAFMYKVEPGGLRIEYVPQNNIDGVRVMERAASPVIIFFFSSER